MILNFLKIDFNTDLTGIGTNGIGSVDLTGVNAGVGSTTVGFTTSSLLKFQHMILILYMHLYLFKIV